MINSRSLDDLHPHVAKLARDFIAACKAEGIDILVTSTYRDGEAQTALYAKGRTKPGPKVTNAKAGFSFHNWHCAFDIVPIEHGKPVWDDHSLWLKIGHIGEKVGLEWAGNWHSFPEFPHFQWTGGATLADFLHGKKLDDFIHRTP